MGYFENLYGGSVSSLDPVYAIQSPYQVPASEIGTSLDARTANQVKEVFEQLNTGVQNIEIAAHSPEVFEAMPKQHLKELNRMAKLTGAEFSMHAPMIDPTGITQQGWQKMNQDAAERQLWDAIKKSHELNPEGNIPVTLHTTTVPLPPAEFRVKEGEKEEVKSVLLVDPNGNLSQIKEEPRFFPREGTKVGELIKFEPGKEIERENKEIWLKQLDNLNFYAHRGEEVVDHIKEALPEEALAAYDLSKTDEKAWQKIKEEHPEMKSLENVDRLLSHGSIYLRDAYMNLKKNYDLVYKNASPEDKAKLNEFAEKEIVPHIKEFDNLEQNPQKLTQFSEMIVKGVKVLGDIQQPKLLMPLRDFAIAKSSETTANLALKSYKEFGDTAPMISLENHPAGMSILTRAKDIKEVIEKAREDFIKKAKEVGISRSEAKQVAEKLIGATWDVGHINMLRRYGYDKADIIKETEIIAPFVKHVHLSDNFGYEHTELPMGMGNVPMKEILEKLGKEGFKGKKIIEALSWWQHFSPGGKQAPPFVPSLAGLGSPIYPMKMAPTWTQLYGQGTPGGYFAGYGAINPEIHHSLYGTGFSALPMELGGQIPGKESQSTGAPMS